MPFVRRDPTGALLSLHRQAEGDATEWLDDDHAQVRAFLGQPGANGFQQLDADFIRVLEDLIDVLTTKGVLSITDLPAGAQSKLLNRSTARKALSSLNNLIDEEEQGGLI